VALFFIAKIANRAGQRFRDLIEFRAHVVSLHLASNASSI
jgi:hypothetical protein